MARVVVCGGATLDMVFAVETLPTTPEKHRAAALRMVGGGAAANAAVAIARLGGDAVLVARVGGDAVGRMIIDDLTAEGVDCAHVAVAPDGASSASAVLVDAQAERLIVNFRGADLAATLESPPQRFDAALADTRWPAAAQAVFGVARRLGVPAVLDGEAPTPPDLAAAATHPAFSLQGLRAFAGVERREEALAAAAARLPGRWTAVTDGGAGVFWIDSVGASGRQAAFPAVAVDTLGAGDVWHGAFALRLAEGAAEPEAARFAAAAAALKCQTPGGRAGAPTRAAVEALLRSAALNPVPSPHCD